MWATLVSLLSLANVRPQNALPIPLAQCERWIDVSSLLKSNVKKPISTTQELLQQLDVVGQPQRHTILAFDTAGMMPLHIPLCPAVVAWESQVSVPTTGFLVPETMENNQHTSLALLDGSPLFQWQWLRLCVMPALARAALSHRVTLLGVPPEECPVHEWAKQIVSQVDEESINSLITATPGEVRDSFMGRFVARLLSRFVSTRVGTWSPCPSSTSTDHPPSTNTSTTTTTTHGKVLPAEALAKLLRRWYHLETTTTTATGESFDILFFTSRPDALLHLLVFCQHFAGKPFRHRVWLAVDSQKKKEEEEDESLLYIPIPLLFAQLQKLSLAQFHTDNILPLCLLVALARNDMTWANALWKSLKPRNILRMPQPPLFRPVRPFLPMKEPHGNATESMAMTAMFEEILNAPLELFVPVVGGGEKNKMDPQKCMAWLEAAWMTYIPPHTFHNRLEWYMTVVSQRFSVPIILPQSWSVQLARGFFEGLRYMLLMSTDSGENAKSMDYFCYSIYKREACGFQQRFVVKAADIVSLIMNPRQRMCIQIGEQKNVPVGIVLADPIPLETHHNPFF